MEKTNISANVSMAMEFPEEMRWAITEVLNGEYDPGYFGENLTILDIGANVGSFTLWANMRWPGSKIHAYEPYPETFKMLVRNTAALDNVTRYNVAVYPSGKKRGMFYSRYAGDGESGLLTYITKIFAEIPREKTFEVSILPPQQLPKADIIKIDTEGAEFQILNDMALQEVSLILLEYNCIADCNLIKNLLQDQFNLEYEDKLDWNPLLPGSNYRKDLAGNYYGRLFFVNKRLQKLRKQAAANHESRPSAADQPFIASTPKPVTRVANLASSSINRRMTLSFPSKEIPTKRVAATRSRRLIYLRDLLRELVGRDLKLRYKRSVLGIIWSLLNPLAQLLILVFVFTLILPLNIPNYTAFLFCGLLTWNWFHASLHQATSTIVDNRELLQRPGFPAAILPVVTVTANLIHLVMALPILLAFLWLGNIQFTVTILALPLLLALQFFLILSLSYFLAAWHVTFRDTQHLLGVALLLGFYVTPIFYEAKVVPPAYEPIFRLNPMGHLLTAYRYVLIRGEWPNGLTLATIAAATALLFITGYRFFKLMSYRFVDEL